MDRCWWFLLTRKRERRLKCYRSAEHSPLVSASRLPHVLKVLWVYNHNGYIFRWVVTKSLTIVWHMGWSYWNLIFYMYYNWRRIPTFGHCVVHIAKNLQGCVNYWFALVFVSIKGRSFLIFNHDAHRLVSLPRLRQWIWHRRRLNDWGLVPPTLPSYRLHHKLWHFILFSDSWHLPTNCNLSSRFDIFKLSVELSDSILQLWSFWFFVFILS